MDSVAGFEGFVLAGGRSSRMGKDKAKLVLGGQTFIERIALELSAVASAVTIVGSNRVRQSDGFKLSGQTLPVVPDVFKEWGALGGLHAALSATRADWALVVACDLPFVTRDLFLRLADLRSDHDAVVPLQGDRRPQPLCAFYRTASCREASEKLIKAGERRPLTLLQSVRTAWVAFEELADINGASRFFENVNTPEDYARAQRRGGRVLVL
jgi:molybdopterin-guanine dinucleotide biosynthesis protein A